MKTLTLPLIAVFWTGIVAAQTKSVPEDVLVFVKQRKVCEHFLGEPVDTNTDEQRERRNFVADSIDINCSGTDKRLAALKRRYKNDRAAMVLLRPFEKRIE
jgi:hypothetical protein